MRVTAARNHKTYQQLVKLIRPKSTEQEEKSAPQYENKEI